MLSYLFYVGIVLPTVVTLALFVFFVICWRKQSARKAVLTKPYDPHGTMRRLGIPYRPPPPPVYARSTLLPFPSELGGDEGGEVNAAYDMSRSPSAEAHAAGANLNPRPLQFLHSPSGGVVLGDVHHLQYHPAEVHQVLLQGSPCGGGPMDVTGRLTFHNRLDSGLSEPTCHSPVNSGGGCVGGAGGVSINPGGGEEGSGGGAGGGGDGEGAGGVGGGGGAASSSSPRERPQSQNSHTSHSSHSTDSEDSGFRSSRSAGLLAGTGTTGGGGVGGGGGSQGAQCGQQESSPGPVVLQRSKSGDRGQGRALDQVHYRVGGGCCHEAEAMNHHHHHHHPQHHPPIQLSPTALWPHHPHIHDQHYPHPQDPHYPHPQHLPSPQDYPPPSAAPLLQDTAVKTTRVDLADIRTQLDWKYLQHLAYPSSPPRGPAVTMGVTGVTTGVRSPTSPTILTDSHRLPVSCHQRLTLAHVHSPCDPQDAPAEVLGFSVV